MIFPTLVGRDAKSVKLPKLGIPNCSQQLWWEKIVKGAEQPKFWCSEWFYTTLVVKDWKMCEMIKIEHSKLFCTTLLGTDWKKCEITKIGHSNSFWTTLVGKDWKRCRMIKIGCSEWFYTTLLRKDQKKCEMTKVGHSESYWTTLVGKDWKRCEMTLGILNHFGPLWWEKMGKVWKDLIGHSKSFQITLGNLTWT